MRIKAMFSGSADWQPIDEKMRRKFAEKSASSAVADYCYGTDVSDYTHARCIRKGDPYTCALWELKKEASNAE